MDIRHHFIRELVQKGVIELTYCPTEDMAADLLTKGLGRLKTMEFRAILLGYIDNSKKYIASGGVGYALHTACIVMYFFFSVPRVVIHVLFHVHCSLIIFRFLLIQSSLILACVLPQGLRIIGIFSRRYRNILTWFSARVTFLKVADEVGTFKYVTIAQNLPHKLF